MKIYTKTGDKGTTALVGGTRVSKTDIRIEAYGEVDELNAYIGLLRDQPVNESRRAILKEIQDRLFTIGSRMATAPDKQKGKLPDLFEEDIELLERSIDEMTDRIEPLRFFVLPGGHTSVSFGHIARTVCRRAERTVLALDAEFPMDPLMYRYLNRLSDYLFVLCRQMAQDLQVEEISWHPRLAGR